MRNIWFAFPLVCLFAALVLAQDLPSLVNHQLPGLIDTYKSLHAHPELSHREERTSALLAAELRKAGYTVTEHVGKYPDGAQAYGIVAILANGPGPTDSR
jgi:hippurate hydrolase